MDSDLIVLLVLLIAVVIGLAIMFNPFRNPRYNRDVTSNQNGLPRHWEG
jgi:hypothetical protein